MTGELHPDQHHASHAGLTDVEMVRWVLRFVKGWSIRKIADEQFVTEAAVKLSLRNAARKIRRAKQEAA